MKRGEKERRVLAALAEHGEMHGYELAQAARLLSGSMYATTTRLLAAGRITARWESGLPSGRPPRRLYRRADTTSIDRRTPVSINEADAPTPDSYYFDVWLADTAPLVIRANDWSREGDSVLFWDGPGKTKCCAMFVFDKVIGIRRDQAAT